jgi:peptidoglycan/LPS O-acetylase OafA/YrhL
VSTETRSNATALITLAAVLDAGFVIAFAAIGRASHDENVLTGLALTAWPFLASLALAWIVLRAWRRPLAPLRTGTGVWLITVAGGMLLRALTGQGVALAFIIVATIVLMLLLVGWRGLATLVRRRPLHR